MTEQFQEKLNNALCVISGYAELILINNKSKDQERIYIEKIINKVSELKRFAEDNTNLS